MAPFPVRLLYEPERRLSAISCCRCLNLCLKANNVLLIRGRDDRFIVSSSQAATQLAPRVVSRDEQVAGYSTMVIPLQYISAGGMAEILKP